MRKPLFLDEDHWKIMLKHWETPQAKKRSKTCSGARKSRRKGYGEHAHTAGAKSFNKTVHEMADANDRIMPSIAELIKKTRTKAGGSFVDKYALLLTNVLRRFLKRCKSWQLKCLPLPTKKDLRVVAKSHLERLLWR